MQPLTVLSFLVLATSAVMAHPLQSHRVGKCSAKKGTIVYFNVDKCNEDFKDNYYPRADQYDKGTSKTYTGIDHAPYTVCIETNIFDGFVYLANKHQAQHVQKLHLNTTQQKAEVYVSTRDDDRAGHVGQEKPRPAVGA